MQIKQEQLTPTSVKLTVTADKAALNSLKESVLKRLGQETKVQGFRPGKAPINLLEKQLDPQTTQSEFLNQAINELLDQAVANQKLRVIKQPEVSLTKFVPYTTLEFSAEVEIIGEVKLANYKTIKVTKPKVEVTTKDVTDVLNNLLDRAAEKKEVKRAAKAGDEVVIDFNGKDTKTKEPIEGASGQSYPLVLGSNSFIPGFEAKLIGLKANEEKTFDITFPADYAVASLKSRKVTFNVKVSEVKELTKPKSDDKFAASVGPFKTLNELKSDIKKQVKAQKEKEANQAYENELIQKIADKSEVALPDSLIEEEIKRLNEDEKRNLVYRGQTWQEHLDQEGLSEEQHSAKQRPIAESRIKAGLILGEIAEKENVKVTRDELEVRLKLLKDQYSQDPSMQAELDKPENQRDILNRLIVEKTLDKLRDLAKA